MSRACSSAGGLRRLGAVESRRSRIDPNAGRFEEGLSASRVVLAADHASLVFRTVCEDLVGSRPECSNGVGSAADPEFQVDGSDVHLDGRTADVPLRGDLTECAVGSQLVQDAEFRRSEAPDARVALIILQLVLESSQPTGQDPPDRDKIRG